MMSFQQNLELRSGENVIDSWGANHAQSAQRAVGGKLWLTNQRLVFLPNAMEKKLAGGPWERSLHQISGVGVVGANLRHIFGGGLRSRLEVTSDSTNLFVVTGVKAVSDRIRVACENAR